MTAKKYKFIPEAAVEYAKQHKWTLPKKLKDADTLIEIMEEHMLDAVKKIKEEDRFECEGCGKVVQDSDKFCWFCGADISDDNTGGFEATGKKIFDDDKEEKKPEPKKEEKKPEPKKEEAKKEEKKAEPKEEKALAKTGEKPIFKTLAEYTKAIKGLNASTGLMAWKIGKYLLEVKENKSYKEGKYATMAEYVQAELEYNWQLARNFMRYATTVQEQQAERLGVYKLELLARSPEESRDRMLKAALPKDSGGQGMSRAQLENKLREEKERLKKPKSTRGRKAEPNKKFTIHKLIGQTIEIKIDDNGTGEEPIPGSMCIVEVRVLKKSAKLTFFEAEMVGDDSDAT